MTVVHQAPPPPTMTHESLVESIQTLTARVAALETERREMGMEVERLQAQVKVLEEEHQWWRRWHLKWGHMFRAWRDGM